MKRSLYTLAICILFLAASHTHAQIPGSNALSGSTLETSPAFPEPGEQVRITLNDYTLNTNGATTAWFIDGVELPESQNQRAITLTAGQLGSQTVITQITTLASGAKIPSVTTLTPVRIDMLIEADTIAPLFYKGRSIPAEGSNVRVTALPFTGDAVSPEAFSYTWKVGGKVIAGGSRFGQNFVSFAADFGRNIPVSVDIYDPQGTLIASETTIVPLVKPELHFYEVNPLRGISERSIDENFIFIGDEIRVRAEPYYIDKSLLSQNPHLEWKLNNRSTTNPSADPQEITLRKEGDRGSFKLEFHIRNLQQLLQGVKDTVTISF